MGRPHSRVSPASTTEKGSTNPSPPGHDACLSFSLYLIRTKRALLTHFYIDYYCITLLNIHKKERMSEKMGYKMSQTSCAETSSSESLLDSVIKAPVFSVSPRAQLTKATQVLKPTSQLPYSIKYERPSEVSCALPAFREQGGVWDALLLSLDENGEEVP